MCKYQPNTMRYLLGAEEPENCKHLREMLLTLNSLAHPIVICLTMANCQAEGKKALQVQQLPTDCKHEKELYEHSAEIQGNFLFIRVHELCYVNGQALYTVHITELYSYFLQCFTCLFKFLQEKKKGQNILIFSFPPLMTLSTSHVNIQYKIFCD